MEKYLVEMSKILMCKSILTYQIPSIIVINTFSSVIITPNQIYQTDCFWPRTVLNTLHLRNHESAKCWLWYQASKKIKFFNMHQKDKFWTRTVSYTNKQLTDIKDHDLAKGWLWCQANNVDGKFSHAPERLFMDKNYLKYSCLKINNWLKWLNIS